MVSTELLLFTQHIYQLGDVDELYMTRPPPMTISDSKYRAIKYEDSFGKRRWMGGIHDIGFIWQAKDLGRYKTRKKCV
jgi:hypothetical protein